jgi:thioredoxin reductase
MFLKSDGFASNLYDPERRFTLRNYCSEQRIEYADYGTPVPLDAFTSYGLAFQRHLVPTLSEKCVVRIEKNAPGFLVSTDDGETIAAERVVIATGISYYSHLPEPLKSLPPEVCSHSFAVGDLARFAGQRVLVIGGGASAVDVAALLAREGASVELVSRNEVEFHRPPEPRTLWARMTEPNLGLGPNFRSALYTAFPGLFRLLPVRLRERIVRRHLGPAAAWFVRDQLIANVPMHTGYEVTAATALAGGVRLSLRAANGRSFESQVDHVIAATGYRVAVDRLDLLAPALRACIATEQGSPALSKWFESSVPGLYFVGIASAATFGPLMRFALGAHYTARRLGQRLGQRLARHSPA